MHQLNKFFAIANLYPQARSKIEGQVIKVEAHAPDGFSFTLAGDATGFTLFAGRWHFFFKDEEEALRIFDKCFSGEAVLRDVTSLGFPYKGTLEDYPPGSEIPVAIYETGLFTVLVLFLFPKQEKRFRNAFEKVPGW